MSGQVELSFARLKLSRAKRREPYATSSPSRTPAVVNPKNSDYLDGAP